MSWKCLKNVQENARCLPTQENITWGIIVPVISRKFLSHLQNLQKSLATETDTL